MAPTARPDGGRGVTAGTTSVEQALHGYRAGHRLLASSVELGAPDRKFLSILTDTPVVDRESSPWSVSLSGWPLPSREWYALTLCWAAEDDRRRGALWAHTLLLGRESFSVSGSIDFAGAFAQPGDYDADLEQFSKPLTLSLRSGEWPTAERDWIAEVAWACHDRPPRPVVLTTDEVPASRHSMLLASWRALWPSVRWNWRFLETASLDGGGAGSEGLPDLAVIRMGSAVPSGVRAVRGRLPTEPPRWASSLADIGLADAERRRRFEATMEVGIDADHESVVGAADVWTAVTSGDLSRTIRLASKHFPSPRAATGLKSQLADSEDSFDGALVTGYPRIVGVIMAADEAFAAREVVEQLRADVRLHADEAPELLVLAADAPLGPVRDSIVIECSELLTERAEWSRVTRTARLTALDVAPAIAEDPQFWLAGDGQALWDALSKSGRRPDPGVLKAMVTGHASVDPRSVYSAWPEAEQLVVDLLARGGLPIAALGPWISQFRQPLRAEALLDMKLGEEGYEEVAAVLRSDSFDGLNGADLHRLLAAAPRSPSLLVHVFKSGASARDREARGAALHAFEALHGLARNRPQLQALSAIQSDVAMVAPAERLARALNLTVRSWQQVPGEIEDLGLDSFEALLAADDKAELAQHLAQVSTLADPTKQRAVAHTIAEKADRDRLSGLLQGLFGLITRR